VDIPLKGFSANNVGGRGFLVAAFWYFGRGILYPAARQKIKLWRVNMRAIIRVILPEVTDEQAIKIKALIEKALKDSVVKRDIEMNLMAR